MTGGNAGLADSFSMSFILEKRKKMIFSSAPRTQPALRIIGEVQLGNRNRPRRGISSINGSRHCYISFNCIQKMTIVIQISKFDFKKPQLCFGLVNLISESIMCIHISKLYPKKPQLYFGLVNLISERIICTSN
jgi:hypothetical protein